MTLRIVHTADNHIGLAFARYPEPLRARLREERFAALERLIRQANDADAHIVTVAGDLFDRVAVPVTEIERTVGILAAFEGEAVLVLAGNHDYCEGPDSPLWKRFRKAAEGTCVIALTERGTHDLQVGDQPVRFYACPCPSKHGREHVIGWVGETPREEGSLHIGMAHGNVEGLGLDATHRYFSMTEQELRAAALDVWLLGHIHVPAPAPGTTGLPLYFMPGTHTPDSVKCTHAGAAWLIELEKGTGAFRFESLPTGALRFVRRTLSLEHAHDVEALSRAAEEPDAPHTILDLQLTGRLKTEEIAELNRVVNQLAESFLHVERDQDIAEMLDAAAIARRFPDRTLPGELLRALLADEAHPGDAHLALSLIEELAER